MRYLMFVCRDERIKFDTAQRERIGPEVEAWVQQMERRGIRLHGDVLAPADAATTVQVRDGEVLIGQGALVQTSEPLSGFNLLECADLQEALEVAAKHPIARFGTVELRPCAQS